MLNVDIIRQEIQAAITIEKGNEERFLTAWKKAIQLAGTEFFENAEGSNKWELKPIYDMVKNFVETGSKSSRLVFLLAIYSFYNSEDAQVWLAMLDCPNICNITARLDDEQRKVIAELMMSYSGW